jgi:hypothetical protein
LLTVSRRAALYQHPGELGLGVRRPQPRPHVPVLLERTLEVRGGLVPTQQRCRQQAEEAGYRSKRQLHIVDHGPVVRPEPRFAS